jgi:TRAP-type C4-dicarboxylate transport system substrate-binding protein
MEFNMRKTFLLLVVAAILGTPCIFAQRGGRAGETVEVKLASPLPKESPWGRTLDKVAVEWNKITNGQVRLSIRHGGIEGPESKMHLSLASDIIQAGVFSSFGLTSIEPSIMTLSAPFLIRNETELNVVMKEVQNDLERKLNSGNYFILAWSKSGFVNIFSRDQIFVPDDLRKAKIASNPDASDMNTTFKTMGFQIVESDWGDVGNKLNAGVVAAAYQNPAAIAAYQLHTILKNMLSTNIAPIMGGIVMNQVTWRKIGELNPRYQAELLSATRRIAGEFDDSLQKTVNDAISTMSRAGLKVNTPTPAQEQQWFSEMERVVPTLLGNAYDRDLYNRVNQILTRHRGGR